MLKAGSRSLADLRCTETRVHRCSPVLTVKIRRSIKGAVACWRARRRNGRAKATVVLLIFRRGFAWKSSLGLATTLLASIESDAALCWHWFGRHKLADGFENVMELAIMFPELRLELVEPPGEFVMGCQNSAELDEDADNPDRHLNRAGAVENACKHGGMSKPQSLPLSIGS
jgi:hypothetical protein